MYARKKFPKLQHFMLKEKIMCFISAKPNVLITGKKTNKGDVTQRDTLSLEK